MPDGHTQAPSCDTCTVPGRCCRVVMLAGGQFPEGETIEQAQAEIDRINTDWRGKTITTNGVDHVEKLPFRPLFKRATDDRWVLWCPELGRDGRCMNYDGRPHACRDFKPGSSFTCVYGDENDDWGKPMNWAL